MFILSYLSFLINKSLRRVMWWLQIKVWRKCFLDRRIRRPWWGDEAWCVWGLTGGRAVVSWSEGSMKQGEIDEVGRLYGIVPPKFMCWSSKRQCDYLETGEIIRLGRIGHNRLSILLRQVSREHLCHLRMQLEVSCLQAKKRFLTKNWNGRTSI